MEENHDEESSLVQKALIAAIVVGVIGLASAYIFSKQHTFEPVQAGKVAPAFTLPDLDGKEHSLSDYKGKVVFLNFWATWCGPCEDEMPSMQTLYRAIGGDDFEILAVSIDEDSPAVVDAYGKKFGITFPILHDRKKKIKEIYKTTGVPETFIIDQNGVIAEKVWGPRDWLTSASTVILRDLLKNGPKDAGEYGRKKVKKEVKDDEPVY